MMRKALLLILLAAIDCTAEAEWIRIGDDDKKTVYADTTSIQSKADKVEMLELHDYKQRQYSSEDIRFRSLVLFVSEKRRVEYDCKNGRARPRHFSFYQEPMGELTGDTMPLSVTTDYKEWVAVSPDTIAALLLKFACAS